MSQHILFVLKPGFYDGEEGPFYCPHCDSNLQEFQYRLYDLKLDYCENEHGFWLDAGEDVRVMGIMALRAAEIERKVDAESEWRGILKQMRAFFKKL